MRRMPRYGAPVAEPIVDIAGADTTGHSPVEPDVWRKNAPPSASFFKSAAEISADALRNAAARAMPSRALFVETGVRAMTAGVTPVAVSGRRISM